MLSQIFGGGEGGGGEGAALVTVANARNIATNLPKGWVRGRYNCTVRVANRLGRVSQCAVMYTPSQCAVIYPSSVRAE